MNEPRETIGADDAPLKKPYAPPRIQRLMGASRDTGNGEATSTPESVCSFCAPS